MKIGETLIGDDGLSEHDDGDHDVSSKKQGGESQTLGFNNLHLEEKEDDEGPGPDDGEDDA